MIHAPRLESITLYRSRNENYTPADLMICWARHTVPRAAFTRRPGGRASITYRGRTYVYDHWTIKHFDEELDEIEVFLKEEGKGE